MFQELLWLNFLGEPSQHIRKHGVQEPWWWVSILACSQCICLHVLWTVWFFLGGCKGWDKNSFSIRCHACEKKKFGMSNHSKQFSIEIRWKLYGKGGNSRKWFFLNRCSFRESQPGPERGEDGQNRWRFDQKRELGGGVKE